MTVEWLCKGEAQREKKRNRITIKESDKKEHLVERGCHFAAFWIEELFRMMVSGDQVERWLGLSSMQAGSQDADRHKM